MTTTENSRDRDAVSLSKSRRRRAGSHAVNATDGDREVLEFDHGVRAYPPTPARPYWRIRWDEDHRHRDTTAKTRAEVIARATDIVERVGRGTDTDLSRALGSDLVAHYLDPRRRPPRVATWSENHRDEQTRYCNRFVLPIIANVPCRELGRRDFQRILDQAPTFSVARQLKRCLSGIVNAGLIEGHLLLRQDVLRGVRWFPADGKDLQPEPAGRGISEDEIPTIGAVHSLALACARKSKVWWRELEILLVAYSGLRWGEHVAVRATQIDATRRRINVDRQIIETRSTLKETLPKGRKRRATMYPACTPGGVDLGAMVERRLAELDTDGLLFPAPKGGWARRSNYGRNLWDPAAVGIGWPRAEDGSWAWTFHSLRHVFATWALAQPGIRLEDVSRLMGHSSVRVTQDIYIHVSSDVYDRFYDATC